MNKAKQLNRRRGLAAALAADKEGAKVLLIERERKLGGILKQCIHDGFGLMTFGERLSGPEYSERFIDKVLASDIEKKLLTFVTKIKKVENEFVIYYVNREGAGHIRTKAIVLATGCRERTAKQVFIHGTRPSGIYTAGTAQYYVNLMGEMPVKRCVILGSGDIGLIMARRLTLEGAEVLGVYEAKPTPSGLTRNIHQCLKDFDIPLHLSHTVTRVFGDDRLTGVEVMKVDENMKPVPGTEERIECDGLILSVGLIPENELAESLDVPIDERTRGPVCDQEYMSEVEGIFCAGNALHVNDLVDYVTENAWSAGKSSAHYEKKERILIPVLPGEGTSYVVPERLNLLASIDNVTMYFRSAREMRNAKLKIRIDGKTVFEKRYQVVRPPEMERLQMDFSRFSIRKNQMIEIILEEA